MAPKGQAGIPPHDTPPQGVPRGNPGLAAGPPRVALCASGEGGGPACGALCSAIELEEGRAPEWVQLFPRGPELAANDGRSWTLADPQAVIRRTRETLGGLDLAIDWDHAQDTPWAGRPGQKRAAAWIRELAVRDGLLMGRAEWTKRGRASVESREYRYVSPAFAQERATDIAAGRLDGGEVIRLAGAGLVNRPAFDMPALAGQQQEDSMLKKILEALGLAADAAEETALAAVERLKSERKTALASAASPPLDKFVPRSQYDAALARATEAEGQLASQAGQARDAEIKRALDKAQAAGKFTPAQRSFFEGQCRAEGGLEAVKGFLAEAPEIAGASGVTGDPPGGGAVATAAARKVASMFGHTPEFVAEHASPLPGGSD